MLQDSPQQLEFDFLDENNKESFQSLSKILEGYKKDRYIYYKFIPIWWCIKNTYYNIHNWFFPRNKWLIKNIPNDWRDKDELIRLVLFNCIVHYIEKEKALKWIVWSDNEKSRQNKEDLIEIYSYAKYGRKALEEKLYLSYPEKDEVGSYQTKYRKTIEIEKEIEEKDGKYLGWIISNRRILWV